MKCSLGIAFALVLVATLLCAAENQPTRLQSLPGHVTTAASVGAHFDPTRTTLPAHFLGNNFEALYRQLSGIGPKGDFETTEQYHARSEKVLRGIYSFRLAPPSFRYDADANRFTVKFYPESVNEGFDINFNHSLLLVRETEKETGHYVGSNAFGGTMVVKKVTRRKWGVILDLSPMNAIEISISAEPEHARAVNKRLAFLAVCEVGPESIPNRMSNKQSADMQEATGYLFFGATFDAPRDHKIYYYAIRADVLAIWVYDSETGEVFGKFDLMGSPLAQ